MNELIQACDIRRSFALGARQLDVLRGVSLAVHAGETLAITGLSGAGKSTLLHILGGLDRPTAGEVLYRGRDFYACRERARAAIRAQKIGFVFQAYHLLPGCPCWKTSCCPASLPGALQGRSCASAPANCSRGRAAERLEHRSRSCPAASSGA